VGTPIDDIFVMEGSSSESKGADDEAEETVPLKSANGAL